MPRSSSPGDALFVTMDGGMPKLTGADAAPDNVKAAVAAVGKLITACQSVVDNTKAIPPARRNSAPRPPAFLRTWGSLATK